MAPPSVPRPVQPVSRRLTKRLAGTKKSHRTRTAKEIFGLLKGWKIDSQTLSNELKD